MRTNQILELAKLTKKQLQTETCMQYNNRAATIGDLTLDQLRVLVHAQMRDLETIDRGTVKIARILGSIMP